MHQLVFVQASRRVIWKEGRVERGGQQVLRIVERLRLWEKDIGVVSDECETGEQFPTVSRPKVLSPR